MDVWGNLANSCEKKRLKQGGKNTQKNYAKKASMTQMTMMVQSLTYTHTSRSVTSSGP